MGNSASSAHMSGNRVGRSTLQDSAEFAVESMVSDVDITSIKKHLKDGNPMKEFMYLESEDFELDDTIEAQKLYNREKNRYTNILPCDHTRVKLSAVEGVEGSDYINANFIDGETERAYIATQGPLMHTRCDFWRMVWENKCKTIVMLGKERENDRVKVDRYWPEPGPDGSLTFGPFVVRALDKDGETGHIIIVRQLEIIHTPTGESRPVTHYQYEGWPDHGVPPNTEPIRHLVHLIEKERLDQPTGPASDSHSNNANPSPVVVHCSAGVGRTGTFCTIHMTLMRLHNELRKGTFHTPPSTPSPLSLSHSSSSLHSSTASLRSSSSALGGTAPPTPPTTLSSTPPAHAKFNLYNTVQKLRRQRPGMVQQQEQYVFCYEAVAEEAEELGLLPRPVGSLNNSLNTVQTITNTDFEDSHDNNNSSSNNDSNNSSSEQRPQD